MVNKKGQEMTLGTIVAIVLGIVVLVLLIWGFSTGWTNMWDQIAGRTSGSNVQLRIADCENDCNNNEKSSWCSEKKDLRFFDDKGDSKKISGSCYQFSVGGVIDDVLLPSGLGFKKCDEKFTCEPEVKAAS